MHKADHLQGPRLYTLIERAVGLSLFSPAQVETELLAAELQLVHAELHRATQQLQERRAAGSRLAAKHAVLTARGRPSDADDGEEPQSQVPDPHHPHGSGI